MQIQITEVFAFECFPKQRPEWARIINAPTASKARYEYAGLKD